MTTPPSGTAGDFSVVIPAHNEQIALPRLLDLLVADSAGIEILVVCNGCSDLTADEARAYADVRVIEIPAASKYLALTTGLDAARHGCVALVDADVEILPASLRRLVAPLSAGRALATGPARALDRIGASWPVRYYYDIWERLPQVRTGLFGRGVIALSPLGVAMVRTLPATISDDLAVSELFGPDERAIVECARVTIRIPRALPDLLRRRTRIAMGNAQADSLALRQQHTRTSVRTLLQLLRRSPLSSPKVVVFLGVTAISRWLAHRASRAGSTVWLRDESSRR